jgi:hypothetical protein
MRARRLAAALLALALFVGGAQAQSALSTFKCPAASQANTSCLCTSGCSINSEFSYLWSNPVFPPASRWLGAGAPRPCGASQHAARGPR